MAQIPTDPRLRIWFSQSWGTVRTEARSYSRKDGAVIAGVDERATYPLFGFHLDVESFRIAEWRDNGVRFYPPPKARLEQATGAGPFTPVPAEALRADGALRFVDLPTGTRMRLREGDSLLTVTVDLLKDRAGWDKKKAMFHLIFLLFAGLGAPLAFLLAGPDPAQAARALGAARVKQGLPAQPEPLNLQDAPPSTEAEPGAHRPKGTIVLPASVR